MKIASNLIRFALPAVALAFAGFAVPAAAADDMITGTSLNLIIKALEANNFKVEKTKTDDGAPLIRSTDEDDPFSIHFYGCDDDHENCTYIQFVSGWNLKSGISLTKIEEWNNTKIWGQAWRDSDQDPWVAVTMNLKGGVSYDNFSDTCDWWRVTMRDFEKHIGWSSD